MVIRIILTMMLSIGSLQVIAESSTSSDHEAADKRNLLFVAMKSRMELMDEVAMYKHQRGLPTVDKKRERKLLKKAVKSAEQYTLEKASIEAFLSAQMSVAKAIQFRHRAFLETSPAAFGNAGSIELSDLRREISEFSDATILYLADYISKYGPITPKHQDEFYDVLELHDVSVIDKNYLFESLTQVVVVEREDTRKSESYVTILK